jgi:WD40 repeat protein
MLPLFAATLLAATQEPLPDHAVLRLSGHADGARAVAWSPDGRSILTGSRDRTLSLWEASTGERVRVLEGHDGGVTSVAFSPDGSPAVSGSQDKSVILLEVASGKLLRA